jgi:hypothetical protein
MKKLSARTYLMKKILDFFIVGIFLLLLLFIWTLYKGPVSVPYLKPYIIQALNYDESDYNISLGDVNMEFVRSIQPLRVTANDISFKKKDGAFSVQAPKLYMSFSLRALLKGIIAPSDVSIEKPTAYIFASYGVEDGEKDTIQRRKIGYYVEKFKEFLNNYNSEDKVYPESFVNNITIKDGELEFHEVELGRKWIFSDIDFEFGRNFVNLQVNANALVNINEKIASVGFESEYHTTGDKLDMEIYFSDLILSDMMNGFNETTQENALTEMSIEVPVNGKINTTLKLAEVLQHPEDAADYLNSAIESIKFEVDGGHGYIAFDNEEKYNYDIDELSLTGEVTGGIDEIHIDNADFKMGGQTASISLYASGLETYYLERSPKDLAVRFTAKVPQFPLDDLSHFWPRYIAEPAWQWCKDGLTGGLAKNAEFVFDFGFNEKTENWGLLNLDGKAELIDGDLFYLEGMPLVHNVYGTAYFTPRNILIEVDKGVTDGVIITGGKVNIYDLDKDDNFISIDLIGNSSITDALNLINNPPLEFTKEMGFDAQKITGNVDVKLKLDFELRQDLDAKDIKVDVQADLHDIKITELVPDHTVSAQDMKLQVTQAGWNLQGDVAYDNMPLKLAVNEKFADKKYKSKCNISFVLNEAAKKTLGLDWSIINAPNIVGYATVNADITVKDDGLTDILVKADLANTKIDYSYFGFVKEAKQPATLKALVKMQNNKVISVSDISLIKSGFTINGNVVMYPSGRVKTVDISDIKGPKTSARAKISLTDSGNPSLKIDVSGNSYDLAPLFDKTDEKDEDKKETPVQKNDDDGLENVNNSDIFIAVNSLWTNETTPIKNFAGSAKLRHGIGIDEIHLVGNYGIDKSIKLKLDYIPKGKNEHYLSIDSNNAGSTLKVLRLYDNMVGGTLKIEARRAADKKFIGHAQVRDFSIQNAPVIAKLLTVASFTGMLDLLKGDGLTFTHFNAPFEYQYKIVKLQDAKAEGNVVGITTGGTFNRATDAIKMAGAIAPAYSLNRLLGKIPMVGNLLASKDGTIFAATYKIDGTGKAPVVDINALSILSPNALKEWYNETFGTNNDLQ